MYRPSVSFIDRSNRLKERTTFCKVHPTGYLGKDKNGQYFKKCWIGFKHDEKCEIVII